ncbi:MAG: hypothetical protein LBT05_04785 [Planctomycetaceae bacterium]|jgi:hypothetical protein|nr:hypothetical protein [Planctomycetaceae bacterium]
MLLKETCLALQYGILRYVPFGWKKYFRDEYNATSRFLYPTNELATSYPGQYDWESYRIVIHEDGRIVGVDDDDFDNRLILTKADITQYKFDLKKFRREICESFGLQVDQSEIGRWDRAIPWGKWEAEKGRTFHVSLLLTNFTQNFNEKLFSYLLQRQGQGEILFTPTRRYWTDNVEELARKNKALLIPLDEVLQMENDQLTPTSDWEKYLTAFCKMIEMDLPSSLKKKQSEFVLAKRGYWIYRFDETETIIDGAASGPAFIQFLLQNPDVEFHAEQLWRNVMGINLSKHSAHFENTFDNQTDFQSIGADNIIDAKAKKEYENRLRELAQERRQAESDKNFSALDKIEEEFETIRSVLESNCGGFRSPKKLGDPALKFRDRIRRGINSFIEHVTSNDTVGGRYLKNTIKKGIFMKYSPSRKIDWIFS